MTRGAQVSRGARVLTLLRNATALRLTDNEDVLLNQVVCRSAEMSVGAVRRSRAVVEGPSTLDAAVDRGQAGAASLVPSRNGGP